MPREDEVLRSIVAENDQFASHLITLCVDRGWFIACAESLTGGLLADAFVRIPGASRAFLGSAVTYHLGAKRSLLGVDGQLLAKEGAVDARVARQMAEGTARAYAPSLIPLTADGATDAHDSDHSDHAHVLHTASTTQSTRAPHSSSDVSSAQLLTLSTTGVAGPDSDGYKPVGLVYVGLRLPGHPAISKELHVTGDREEIRLRTVHEALSWAISECCDSSARYTNVTNR